MTNLPEAKLAREAEIALATLGMVTDYDSWRSEDESVTASSVVEHLVANAKMSQAVMKRAIALIPAEPDWPEHSSLDAAIFTPREHWSEEVVEKLRPILNGR